MVAVKDPVKPKSITDTGDFELALCCGSGRPGGGVSFLPI